MKAAVCFKAVRELEKILPSDWQSFDKEPDLSYVGTEIGCFDEAALEMALRLKDNNPDIFCTALTFGELPSGLSRRIYAAGFDTVVQLKAENTEFSAKNTADRLFSWLSLDPHDIIICGERSALNDSGSVPYYLAERLGLPIIPMAAEAEIVNEHLKVKQELHDGAAVSEIALPAVLVAGRNTDTLRLASLRAQIATSKKQPEIIMSEDSSAREIKLIPAKAAHCCYPGYNAAETAAWIKALAAEAAE